MTTGPGVLEHDVAGAGPALLLVHAGIADRRMWDDQMAPFAAADWTVIRADLPGVGGEVAAPTLVLVGDHDRPDIQAIAGALAAGSPGAERAVLAVTAHLPNMERPEEFNRVVLEFLARLDRTDRSP